MYSDDEWMSAVNDGVMMVRASEAASAASATDTHQHTSGNVFGDDDCCCCGDVC